MAEFSPVMYITGRAMGYLALLSSHVVACSLSLTGFIEGDRENRITGASLGILLRQNYFAVLLDEQRVGKSG